LENLTKEKPKVMMPAESEDSFDMDYTMFKGLVIREEDAREKVAEKARKEAEEYAKR